MSNNIKLMDVKFNEQEKHLEVLQDDFNRMCLENYPDVLSWSHFDLYSKSVIPNCSPQSWKEFKMNPKIQRWYDEEQQLQLDRTIMQIMNEIRDGKSTGQAQTLTAMLNQKSKNQATTQSTTKIVYSFVPLTEFEKENPNINVLQTIPTEIRDAIQIIGPSNKNPEKD